MTLEVSNPTPPLAEFSRKQVSLFRAAESAHRSPRKAAGLPGKLCFVVEGLTALKSKQT